MIFDYTFLLVLFSCAVLAAVSSMIGLVVVLQKESLLGDALSHAALPGVVIAFLLIQQKITIILLLGAFVSGIIAVTIIKFIKENTNLAFDGILAIILSSFFGFGMVLLTYSQKLPTAAQAGLKNFIFGQASSILQADAWMIFIVSIIVFIIFILCWKEIKLFVFDPLFAKTSGFNANLINIVISSLMTAVIIIELQTVGIILTSAMLIAPGVAALQWTKSFGKAVLLAMLNGIIAAIIGTSFSSVFSNVPTGPAIVVVISCITLFSIFFGKYGVAREKMQQRKYQNKLVKGE
jgi:ABC-type Mn2+/Zn2+ transport systems, permease components